MSVPPPKVALPVREMLRSLEFEPVWDAMTDRPPAYRYARGGIDIEVAEVTGRSMEAEFLIGGFAQNERTIRYIERSMPLVVESREQLVAWLAYAVGVQFVPTRTVSWFDEGKRHQGHLPWEKAWAERREQARRREETRSLRPYCDVPREWMRQLRGHVRAYAGSSTPDERFRCSFDGQMLIIRLPASSLGVPAVGSKAWSEVFEGQLQHLAGLPSRFQQDPVTVGIWEGHLEVDRWSIPVRQLGGDHQPPGTSGAVGSPSCDQVFTDSTSDAALAADPELQAALGHLGDVLGAIHGGSKRSEAGP